MFRVLNALRGVAVGLAALGIPVIAAAAPFSISHTGTIYASNFPQIINGQPYTVTLVLDNGGATAASQSWTKPALKCAIFRMNAGGTVAFAQDLAATNSELSVTGSIATDGSGALTSIFSAIIDQTGPSAGTYSAAGFAPPPPIYWYLNSNNYIFYANANAVPALQYQFGDPSGGVAMSIAGWTNPQPFAGTCSATVPVLPPGGATSVPALGEWALALLSLSLAAGTMLLLRRRRF